MCIIIYQKDASIPVKAEWFKNSADSNADGFGMSFLNDGKLEIYKTMDFNEFRLYYRKMSDENPKSPFLLHFRKNTVGLNSLENCHPFKIKGDVAMMHNGGISNVVVPKLGTKSDTNIFATEVLDNLPLGWESNKAVLRLLKTFIAYSKLAIMNKKGEVSLVNEGDGHWYEGLWMSNYSYYPSTKSIQKTKPKTWDENTKTKALAIVDKTYKTQVYKHPNGDFSRYLKGKLLRWFSTLYSWREVTNENVMKIAGMSLHSDAPSTKHHMIVVSASDIEERSTPTVYCGKKHQCGYCGDKFDTKDLTIFFVEYQLADEDSPYDVFCKECAGEIEEAEMGRPRNHFNVDYFLRDRANSLPY